MKFQQSHLTYCMNVHPAKNLDDVFLNINSYAKRVKNRIGKNRPFGLGLWLPSASVKGLKKNLQSFQSHLQSNGFYVFTMNGFPMGTFHKSKVKKKVYYPDWGDTRRLKYTEDLLDILAELLPVNCEGSVSTVPITYGKLAPKQSFDFLLKAVDKCRNIFFEKGKKIWIAIEPEPDCYLENTPETISFFNQLRDQDPDIDQFLGICFDTCHFCLQGEILTESITQLTENNIRIPKVQISTALSCNNFSASIARENLQKFAEPVYLHQTRVFDKNTGELTHRYADLGDALRENPAGLWLVHFHVPIYFTGGEFITSTQNQLTEEVLELLFKVSKNVEIETYTLEILLSQGDQETVDSIVKEFQWLFDKMPVSQ